MDEKKLQIIIELLTKGDASTALKELEDVKAKSDKANQSSNELTKTIEGKIKSYIGLGAVIAAATALVRESIQAFDEKTRSLQTLDGTLKATGQHTEEYSKYLQNLADTLKDEVKVSDDSIIAAERQLIAFGATRDEVERLTRVILDMNAAGIDLQTGATAIGAALNGEFGAATRILKIDLDESATRAEKFNTVLTTMEGRFGGMAAASAHSASGIKELSLAFDDVKEDFGETLSKFIRPMNEALIDTVKYLQTTFQMWGAFSTTGSFSIPTLEGRAPASPTSNDDISRNRDPKIAAQRIDLLEKEIQLTTKILQLQHAFDPATIIDANNQSRQKLIEQLHQTGVINDHEFADYRTKFTQQYQEELLQIGQIGEKMEDEVRARHQGGRAVELLDIRRHYDQLEDGIRGYYKTLEMLADGSAEKIAKIEERKNQTLGMLDKQREHAVSQSYQIIQQVGQMAAHNFSSGFANAIVETVRNIDDADKAWQSFAANFLASIAEMILQQIIFNAIKNSSFGGWLGLSTGGQVVAAANGVVMAAGGVDGVTELNSPTYFPKFNVLAGEAGREVMTVMARPQLVNINGINAQIGDVGPNRLALINAADLMQLRSPMKFAEGGMTMPSAMPSVSSASSGGKTVVEIRMDPSLRAQIVEQARDAAVIQVTHDMTHQTPLSDATKALIR